jgi:outer membrane immunogenic protein
MKSIGYLAALAAGILVSGGAQAAGPDWTGAYVGIHGGYAWGDVSVRDNPDDGIPEGPYDYDASGIFGGITAGSNWQSGAFLLGIEGDLGYMDLSGAGIIPSSHEGQHQDITLGSGLYGDITGRLGLAFGQTLFYGKGGFAFYSGEAMQATTVDGYVPTGTGTFTGWTAGAGIEQMFGNGLSVKLEYLHFDFGTQEAYQTALYDDYPTTAGYEFKNWTSLKADSIKLGINKHF